MGTGKRLNLGGSRRIIEDDDNDSEHGNEEHGNEEQTGYSPSNPDSPSRREESTPKQKVTFSFVFHMRGFPKLNPLYDYLYILTITSLLNFHPRRAMEKRKSHLHLRR